MRRNVSKITAEHIDNFMIGKTNSITVSNSSDGVFKSKETNLFQYLDEKKKVIGYLDSLGLDAFKKGTKEPEAIRVALSTAKWDDVMKASAPLGVKSMWD